MTTLRDLLNDFASDILELKAGNTNLGNIFHDTGCTCIDCVNEVIDTYIETIKERIVG